MKPTETILADAQNTFDIAVRRHAELHAAAVQARRDADNATDLAHEMLDRAAAGTGTVDTAEHAQADLDAVRLAHGADVAEAVAAGSLKHKEQAEVHLLRAKADQHVAQIARLARLELEAAEMFDTKLAEARLYLGLFRIAAQATATATAEAVEFDQQLPVLATRNAVLAAMPSPERPRTRVELRHASAGIDLPLTWTDLNGNLHHLAGAFADWRASSLARFIDVGQRAAARMLPMLSVMGRARL